MATDVYDDEKKIEANHPSLASAESKKANGTGIARFNNSSDEAHFYSGTQLKDKEKSISGEGGEGFFKPADTETTTSTSFTKRVTNVVTNNKKASIFGGSAGAIIITAVLGIGAFVPYELVHMEKVLIKYEAKIEQHFEQKAADKLLQKVVCQQTTPTCDGETNPDETEVNGETESEQATQEAAQNEDLANDVDNEMQLDTPTIKADLAKVGITEEFNADNQLTALENSSGQNVTEDIGSGSDQALDDDLETALPELNAGTINSLIPTAIDQADAPFDGIPPDTPTDQVNTDVEDDVTEGANGGDTLETQAQEEDDCTAKTCPSEQNDPNYATQSGEEGALATAEDKIQADLSAGDSETTALNDGVSALADDLGGGVGGVVSKGLIIGVADYACDIYKTVASASGKRVPTIQKLLLRHASLLFSLADELKSGHLSSDDLNQVMKLYNGNSDVAPTKSDPTPESSLPFTSSAAYQSAVGGSGGVAISTSSKPTADAGTQLVNEVEGYIPLPICQILLSPIGTVIQGMTAVFQFFADDFTLGAAEAATIGGNVAFQVALENTLLPDIIKYFTPIGLGGLEDSVQWFNNADAGTNLLYNTYSRSIGGLPQTNASADSLASEATEDEAVAEAHEPLSTRLFAVSDPDSLVSRVVGSLPVGMSSTISSLENYTLHFPSIALRTFSSIFTNKIYAQSAPTNPGEPYGITQYALTDTQATQFDPIANEQYLFGNVSWGGKSVQRITVLGNPSTYVPASMGDNTLGDTVSTDLLHCFVDSFVSIEENTVPPGQSAGSNTNCNGIGTYDYGSNTPTGNITTQMDSTIVTMYCNALVNAGAKSKQSCGSVVTPQVNDDIEHYSQYLLDLHVMNDYVSLNTSS